MADADKIISDLTELITPADGDLLPIIDDPAGTPVTKKITRQNLLDGFTDPIYAGKKIVIINPYVDKDNEYQGQLHCHSTGSDGVDTPTALETAYKDAGYDFVSITDHDVLTADPGVSGILHIPGVEETATEGHILSINPTTALADTPAQDIIDAILADDAIPFMAHPALGGTHWTDAELEQIKDYFGIEVYNDYSTGSNSEDEWDTLLTKHIRSYGTAGDDCHNIAGGDFNVAWVQVFADTLTLANIVDSLKRGNFYSSTGPTLSISVAGKVITATTGTSSTITFIGKDGDTLQTTSNVTTASYTIVGHEIYVRIKITRDSDSKLAWSNPIYIYLMPTIREPSNAVLTTTAKARAYMSTNQLDIASGVNTALALDTESYDPGSNFNTTTYRFTAPVTGWYLVTGAIYYYGPSMVADKRYSALVQVNGATKIDSTLQASVKDYLSVLVSDILYLTAADYIKLIAVHLAGVDTVDILAGEQYTYLTAHLLSE